MKIAVIPPRRDVNVTLVALAIAAASAGKMNLLHRPADPRYQPPWDWEALGIPVTLQSRHDIAAAINTVLADENQDWVIDHGFFSEEFDLDALQANLDVMVIPVRPCLSEEVPGLQLWARLEKTREENGMGAVPVLLPIEHPVTGEFERDWRRATRLRQDWFYRIHRRPRMMPSALPPLPRVLRDRIFAREAASLPQQVVRAGLWILKGCHSFRSHPGVDWEFLRRYWMFLEVFDPIPPLAGDPFALLAEDLSSYEVEGPEPEELEAAPLLENWRLLEHTAYHLSGEVHGHPGNPRGHAYNSTQVVEIDQVAGWARSQSRLYRLGAPAKDRP